MERKLNIHKSDWNNPKVEYTINHIEDDALAISPGHYRLTTATGTPRAIGSFSGEPYIILDQDIIYNGVTSALGVDVDHAVSFNNVLILDISKAMYSWDPNFGLNQLGEPRCTSTLTLGKTAASTAIEAGEYFYRLVWKDKYDNRSQPTASSFNITVVAGDQIDLSNIVHSSSSIAYSCEIYRTYKSTVDNSWSGIFHLVGEVLVGTTTYTDTTPDSSLTETLRYGLDWSKDYRVRPAGHTPYTWGTRLAWAKDNTFSYSAISLDGLPRFGETERTYPVGDSAPVVAFGNHNGNLVIFKTNGIYMFDKNFSRIEKISSYGVSDKYKVADYGDSCIYTCGNKVYTLPNKEISTDVSPMFSDLTLFVQGSERISVCHKGYIYVTGLVSDHYTTPYFASPRYVTYIYARGLWTRKLNLDIRYLHADFTQSRTTFLNELGQEEKFTWDYARERTLYPICEAATIAAADTIIVSSSANHLVGDHVYLYVENKIKCTKIKAIPVVNLLTLEDSFLDPLTPTVICGIGTIYFEKRTPLTNNGSDLQIDGIKLVSQNIPSASFLSFSYDQKVEGNLTSLLQITNNYIKLGNTRTSWLLFPIFCGLVHGDVKIYEEILTAKKAGTR